jgi:hypothetical protein
MVMVMVMMVKVMVKVMVLVMVIFKFLEGFFARVWPGLLFMRSGTHILPSENHKVVRRQGGRNINLLLVPVVI